MCITTRSTAAKPAKEPRHVVLRYQWEVPRQGVALVGWRVMAFFEDRRGWYDGVVVQHLSESWYTVFHDEDDEHEDWELPDPELVFMRESVSDHMVQVSRSMLPGV